MARHRTERGGRERRIQKGEETKGWQGHTQEVAVALTVTAPKRMLEQFERTTTKETTTTTSSSYDFEALPSTWHKFFLFFFKLLQ